MSTNDNCLAGMACPNPECKSAGPFHIDVTMTMIVCDDGTEGTAPQPNLHWEDDSYCMCVECGHAATVGDFSTGGAK